MTEAPETRVTPEREAAIRAAVAEWRHAPPVGTIGRLLQDAVALLDAERAKVAAPAGWKLVPIEPTPGMISAAIAVLKHDPSCAPTQSERRIQTKAWDAALTAAPEAPR